MLRIVCCFVTINSGWVVGLGIIEFLFLAIYWQEEDCCGMVKTTLEAKLCEN